MKKDFKPNKQYQAIRDEKLNDNAKVIFMYLCGNDLRKFSPSKTKMMTDLNKSKATIERGLYMLRDNNYIFLTIGGQKGWIIIEILD